MSKATYHHGNLRQEMVAATGRFIEAKGLEELSLRRIAKEIGVSHSAPYAHFKCAEDLLAAVKEDGFFRLHQSLEEQVKGEDKAAEKARALMHAYVAFAQSNPGSFHVMFHRPLKSEPSIPYSYVAQGRQSLQLAIDILRDIVGAEQARDQALLCWSTIHGLCSLWVGRTMPLSIETDTEFDHLAENTIGSLCKCFMNI